MIAETTPTSTAPSPSYTDRRRACKRAYYERNKDKVCAQNRAYRSANLEKLKAASRDYYRAHKAKLNAYARAYNAAHLEACRARKRADYMVRKLAGEDTAIVLLNQASQARASQRCERWTDEDIKRLTALYAELVPVPEICTALGRTYSSVVTRANLLGITVSQQARGERRR
jgi:hypothetical protein